MKKILLLLPLLFLVSCAGNAPTGYDGAKMRQAIKAMNENQINTRVFNATGWNPHL